MAEERVASASMPDVTQTDSTNTTMPVALVRRAEVDTRTWVRESRTHRNALQPAQRNTAHKSTSAVCSCRLQSSTRPGRCLIHLSHPGWRPASPEGQPRRQVNHQTNQKMKTAAMPTQCKPDTQTQARVIQPPTPTQKCDSDQHNTRREANPVGPSHRNSRPRDSSTKPMLPPSQAI
jgi:hypothetical protein